MSLQIHICTSLSFKHFCLQVVLILLNTLLPSLSLNCQTPFGEIKNKDSFLTAYMQYLRSLNHQSKLVGACQTSIYRDEQRCQDSSFKL